MTMNDVEGMAVKRGSDASTQLFLLVVASAVFVTTLTGSMVNVVILIMRAEFAASAAHVSWIVTAYALAYAIGVPLYGRVSDLFGVRRVFAFIQSPANSAAANALPQEEVGGGMGLFAGAFFLGSGTGPALIGAFLAARQEAGSGALNSLYSLDASAFSDVFLSIVLALMIALIAAVGLRSRVEKV
jgi:MFS family permease